MSTEVETLLQTLREKVEEAHRTAEFYTLMIREIESVSGTVAPRRAEKPGAADGGEPDSKSGRSRGAPVQAEITAAEAVTRLLSGCKMGLPAGEIIGYVTATWGHRANSIRTTLYNLKKKGAVRQDEQGIYHHPDNLA